MEDGGGEDSSIRDAWHGLQVMSLVSFFVFLVNLGFTRKKESKEVRCWGVTYTFSENKVTWEYIELRDISRKE